MLEALARLNLELAKLEGKKKATALGIAVALAVALAQHARQAFGDYIGQYYPELSKAMDLSNWGPVGTPEQIIADVEMALGR